MAANPNATWTELVLAAQGYIQGLELVYGANGTSLPESQVTAWKIVTDAYRLPGVSGGMAVKLPSIQCAPGRLEDVADKLQDFEDTTVIYPVVVAILFASNHSLAINNDLLYWRQEIYNAFEDYPAELESYMAEQISDVVVWDCQITTQPVIDTSMWQQENLDFSWLVLNFSTTRTRGRS